MNKSFIKFITDIGPLLIFFIYYYRNDKDISVAIPPLIIATLIAVVIAFFLEKKIPFIPLLGAILVSVFGGLSLYFNNPVFIYLKPTIINLIFAVILIIGQRFFQKNLIQMLLSNLFR